MRIYAKFPIDVLTLHLLLFFTLQPLIIHCQYHTINNFLGFYFYAGKKRFFIPTVYLLEREIYTIFSLLKSQYGVDVLDEPISKLESLWPLDDSKIKEALRIDGRITDVNERGFLESLRIGIIEIYLNPSLSYPYI